MNECRMTDEEIKKNFNTNECLIYNLTEKVTNLEKENAKQKEQIEKMKSFIHSEIDFCMYCPVTNECENSEGTCPYACVTEEEQKNLLMDFIQKWELAE